MNYRIKMVWDNDAAVWVATSEDVPGLVLESGSYDALIERVRHAVPELIEMNDAKLQAYKLAYITEREDVVTIYG